MLTGSPAEPPGLGHPTVLTSATDSLLPDVHRITGVDVAHSAGLTGAGQTVVIIDSGVAYDHPALGGGLGPNSRVVGGWDFTEENDADPYDDGPAGFHGTHVAGIIASQDAKHLGVAPEADIVALRVFNDAGRGKLSWLEASLDWVIENRDTFEHPITTVNMSIGTVWNDLELPDYAKLEDELHALEQAGIFVTGAAGNRFNTENASSNQVGLAYPAVSPHVIAAASSDREGQLSEFSQRHGSVLVVPGEAITSTVPDFLNDFNGKTDDFSAATGTSMAAPYLAGASMLVRQAMERGGHEDISVDAIYDVLADTSDRVFDSATQQAYQRVNVSRAIESVSNSAHQASEPQIDFPTEVTTEPVAKELPSSSPDVYSQGSQLVVNGTAANDDIQLDQRGFVRLNGVRHGFDPNAIRGITITGEGEDRLTIDVRQPGSHAKLEPRSVQLQSGSYTLHATGFARVDVLSRTQDLTASFSGGEQREQFYIKPGSSWMESPDSVAYVHGATQVTAHANDQRDSATIYDSVGDDRAVVSAQSAKLTAGNFTAEAHGFSSYQLHATSGGTDHVTLIGTRGDDAVRSKPESISLRSDTHVVHARGYDTREVQGRGGKDRARLDGSPGDDVLTVTPNRDTIVTPGTSTEIRNFTTVDAIANAGYDAVSYVGTFRDEAFIAKPSYSFAAFPKSHHSATGFEATVIDAASGQDSVWLYDAEGDDSFRIGPHESSAHGLGFEYLVRNSEYVHAISRFGADTATLIEREATDRIFAKDATLTLRSDGFTSVAQGFRHAQRNDGVSESETDSDDLLLAALSSLLDDELDVTPNSI